MLHILLHSLAVVGMSLLWLILTVVGLVTLLLLPMAIHECWWGGKAPLRRGQWTLDLDEGRVGIGILLIRNGYGAVRQVGIHWGFHTLTWLRTKR